MNQKDTFIMNQNTQSSRTEKLAVYARNKTNILVKTQRIFGYLYDPCKCN